MNSKDEPDGLAIMGQMVALARQMGLMALG